MRQAANNSTTMLSPLPRYTSRPRSRSSGTIPSDNSRMSLSPMMPQTPPPRTPHRKVDTVIANMGLLVDEIVSKRVAWNKSPRSKRKLFDLQLEQSPSVSPPSPSLIPSSQDIPYSSVEGTAKELDPDYAKLQEYIAKQLSKLPPPPSITVSGSDVDHDQSISVGSSEDSVLCPSPLASPVAFSSCHTPLFDSESIQFDESLFNSISGWSVPSSPVSTVVISPPRSPVLGSVGNRELFQYYLEVSAQRLADTSPSYIGLFTKYVPAMAQESPALMEAILGLAALQMGLGNGGEDPELSVRATAHYQKALQLHYENLQIPEILSSDIPLATSMIFSHFELWSGELIKLGVHMNGCRDIIQARGKAAHMTPIGRALLAAFRRLDVSSSAISGNASFQTEDWWTADPLTRVPIAPDSPPLLAADAAFSKLCVICSKLCHLKAWVIQRRRKVYQDTIESPEAVRTAKKEALESKIERRISHLEDDLRKWREELPSTFEPLQRQSRTSASEERELQEETGESDLEEDINSVENPEIVPKFYKHKTIGLVVAYGVGVEVQLYRLRHPDVLVVGPEIGSQCHALLRIFAGLPSTCDAAMTAPLFAIAIELRQKPHQTWLLSLLDSRISETGLYAMKFVADGVRYAYSKLDGLRQGPFIKIKEGAAARIDGVSENLWSAEGMLRSIEALSLYEELGASVGIGIKKRLFTGDGYEINDEEDELEEDIEASGNSEVNKDGREDQQGHGQGEGADLPYERSRLPEGYILSRPSSSLSVYSLTGSPECFHTLGCFENPEDRRKRRKSESSAYGPSVVIDAC